METANFIDEQGTCDEQAASRLSAWKFLLAARFDGTRR